MESLNEQIKERIYHFTEVLNNMTANRDNTYIPKTIKEIDKLVNVLYTDLYSLIDNKKISTIQDKKCGHCG